MSVLHFEIYGFCINISFYDFHRDSIRSLEQRYEGEDLKKKHS